MRPMLTISAVVLLHLGVIAVLVGVNGCRTTTGFEKTGDLGAFAGTAGAVSGSGSGLAPTPAAVGGLNEAPAPAPARPVVQAAGPGGTHVVVKGENLYVIARREGVTLAQLAGANGLELNAVLRVGQKLTIPAKDYVAPAAKPGAPAQGSGSAPVSNLPAVPAGGFGGFGGAPAQAEPAPAAPAAPAPAAPAAPAPTPGVPPGGFGGFGGSR